MASSRRYSGHSTNDALVGSAIATMRFLPRALHCSRHLSDRDSPISGPSRTAKTVCVANALRPTALHTRSATLSAKVSGWLMPSSSRANPFRRLASSCAPHDPQSAEYATPAAYCGSDSRKLSCGLGTAEGQGADGSEGYQGSDAHRIRRGAWTLGVHCAPVRSARPAHGHGSCPGGCTEATRRQRRKGERRGRRGSRSEHVTPCNLTRTRSIPSSTLQSSVHGSASSGCWSAVNRSWGANTRVNPQHGDQERARVCKGRSGASTGGGVNETHGQVQQGGGG
jgi:hypothetical protein